MHHPFCVQGEFTVVLKDCFIILALYGRRIIILEHVGSVLLLPSHIASFILRSGNFHLSFIKARCG